MTAHTGPTLKKVLSVQMELQEMTTATLTLTRQQALRLAGSRAGADFIINALACTQSDTAQTRKGWFYKSLREWKKIGLSQTSVTNHTRKLINSGVLTSYSEKDHTRIVGGIRRWYRINLDALQTAIEALESPVKKKVKQVRETVANTATSVRKLACKAVDMGKKVFNPASHEQKTLTSITPIHYEKLDEFTAYVTTAGGSVLKNQFDRFGMKSHYVQAAYASFVETLNQEKKKVNRKRAVGDIDYPQTLNQAAWQQWLEYRQNERGLTYKTVESEQLAVAEFVKRCPDTSHQQAWVNSSIVAQYQRLCPPPFIPSQVTRMTTKEVINASQSDRFYFNFDEDEDEA